MTAAVPSFEEVALRLVGTDDPAALQTFLLTKLHTLGAADKAQVTRSRGCPPDIRVMTANVSRLLFACHPQA